MDELSRVTSCLRDSAQLSTLPAWARGEMSTAADALDELRAKVAALEARVSAAESDARRLDYIERAFSGMTNRERYLPVQMIWGKGSNGRTLREACDKYMKRDAALAQGAGP